MELRHNDFASSAKRPDATNCPFSLLERLANQSLLTAAFRNVRMSKMLKSSGGIGAATLTSRVLGLVRDQSFAAFMGTHGVAAAFSYAFMVPNLVPPPAGRGRVDGGVHPHLQGQGKKRRRSAMWQAANAVISGLLVVAPAIVVVAMLVISLLLLGGRLGRRTPA